MKWLAILASILGFNFQATAVEFFESPRVEIRVYGDVNANGVWDAEETSTGEVFDFEYRVNGERAKKYQTDPGTGGGVYIYVDEGSKVEIKQLDKENWINTTSTIRYVWAESNKMYKQDFGVRLMPDYKEAEAPAVSPETGV